MSIAKTIAVIHEVETKYINKLINNNINRFGVNDLLDLLSSSDELRNFALENGMIGSNRTKNVDMLSERGYAKLIKIMDSDLAWEIHDKLIDEWKAYPFNNQRQSNQSQKSPFKCWIKCM